ncbi:hypothetical protein [Frigidibacter sp. ROC022]|uniref:hypothetical protein n=1 Tax=Frigidibacter sp. ROC022 TaxID=2971796 RepID=UPI00215AE672|nr:hypothetical protein [Frigidibacter sp. ROC022]MCR8725595.1 hypothetical protein [Frigidibacter sp. ROC022]
MSDLSMIAVGGIGFRPNRHVGDGEGCNSYGIGGALMKKGEKPKFDVAWWKKNKSKRLGSKDFEKRLTTFISEEKFALGRKDDPKAFLEASNAASFAAKEAKALVAKCGRGQDETKSVLELYVKELTTRGKALNKKYLELLKGTSASESVVSKAAKVIEKEVKTFLSIEKAAKDMQKQLPALIAKAGPKQVVTNYKTLLKALDASESKVEKAQDEIDKQVKSGKLRGKSMEEAEKFLHRAKEVLSIGFRADTEISGVKIKLEELVKSAKSGKKDKGKEKV